MGRGARGSCHCLQAPCAPVGSVLGRRRLCPGHRGALSVASQETSLLVMALSQLGLPVGAQGGGCTSPGASRIRPSSPHPNVASHLDFPADFFCGWERGADMGASGVLLPRGGPKVSGKQQQPWPVHRSAPENPHDITFMSRFAPADGEKLLTSDLASRWKCDAGAWLPSKLSLSPFRALN